MKHLFILFASVLSYGQTQQLLISQKISAPTGITLITSDLATNSNSASVTPNAGGAGVNTTGANFFACVTGQAGANAAVVTDNQSNSYTGLTRYGTLNTTATCQIFYKFNPTTSATTKWTSTASSSAPALACVALSGVGSFDTGQDHGNSSASATTQQATASVTPSVNNALVVTGFITNTGTSAPTVDAPFSPPTQAHGLNTGTSEGVAIAIEIQGTATSRNPTWTRQPSGTATMATCEAVFIP